MILNSCCDADVKSHGGSTKGHFVDPLLKLCVGCPLMLTSNDDVSNGLANGTLCILKGVFLKKGIEEKDTQVGCMDGHWVRMVDASQVDYLLCQHDCGDSFCRTFKVEPRRELCAVRLNTDFLDGIKQKTTVKMHMDQLQLLVNNATTGHKLQGRSVDTIFISNQSKCVNWPCVVLSRVKTLEGLFL